VHFHWLNIKRISQMPPKRLHREYHVQLQSGCQAADRRIVAQCTELVGQHMRALEMATIRKLASDTASTKANLGASALLKLDMALWHTSKACS
jgi:hypothetical protein